MDKEIECKAIIDKETFERIESYFSQKYSCKTYIQINYYYDTVNREIKNTGGTLRIRKKGIKYTLEYKHDRHDEGNYLVCREDHIEMHEVPERIPDSVSQILGIHFVNLLLLGSLETIRTDISIGDALISLDRNSYNGITDYEIEVEEANSTAINWSNYCPIYIDFTRKPIGKYTRFLNTLH
jgi:uncharacterized protein YjbK